jgi:GNAT superfamily N-acetyltransferase
VTPEILPVDHELRLRHCAGDEDVDAGTQREAYAVERLMADDWVVIGDVTLAPDTLPLVIAPEHRGQGIGRRVLLRLVDRARVLGWPELRVREVLPGNDASHRLFSGLGFVACSAPPSAYVLRLAPLAVRYRP